MGEPKPKPKNLKIIKQQVLEFYRREKISVDERSRYDVIVKSSLREIRKYYLTRFKKMFKFCKNKNKKRFEDSLLKYIDMEFIQST